MTHLTFIRYFVPDSNEFAPGWYQTRNEGRTRIGDVPLSLSDALYDGPNRVIIDDNTPETNTLPVSGGKGVDEFLITLTANSVVIDDDSEANVIVFERDVVITSIERPAGSEGASVAQYVITLSSGKTITLRNPASFTFQHLGDATRTAPISAEDFVTAYEDGFAASDVSHPDIIGDASGPSGSDFVGAAFEGDLSTSGDLDPASDVTLATTTPFTISTQGTYGTASINDDGEWVYTLDNGNADVIALNSGETLTDTFVVNITATDGAQTQTITITISGRTDVLGTNAGNNDLGDASTADHQAIFGFNSDDILTGGSGDDLLVGGYGFDDIDLSAGGIDTVVYRINSSDGDGLVKAEDGGDTVIEFTPGEDKLVILDVNGSPTTFAGLFDSLTGTFRLGISGDTDGDFILSSRELDDGARTFMDIVFQSGGTPDGDPASAGAGRTLRIFFDRVTSEALNDMTIWDTLTGGTNFSSDTISTVAQLNSLFGGFGRPGYDAALDDGGFISIIGPDDLPDSYFEIVPIIQRNSLTYNPDETSITIDETILKITSENQSDPTLLVYTITTLPDAGRLLKSGTPLNNGDTFTQADINNGLITYEPSVSDSSTSQSNPLSFTFSDGEADGLMETLQITSRKVVEYTASAQDNTIGPFEAAPQKINGGDGSDIITGGAGDDQIDGDAGDDEIKLTRDDNGEQVDAGADEVLYTFGYDGVGIDGGDEIVGFKRGQDKVTFVVQDSRQFTNLEKFLGSLKGVDDEDLTADDAFITTLMWGLDENGVFYFDGVLLHFKEGTSFGGGRVSSPLVTVTFDERLDLNDLVEILGGADKVADNFDFTHAAFKNLNEVLPRLFGESSVDFVVIPFSNSISVIDGPVTGAEVFFDIDDDGEVSDVEKDAQRDASGRSLYITGDDGSVSIPEEYVGLAFVADVDGAYDTDSGARLEGEFRSLDEGRGGIATPITDLIVTYLEEVEGQAGTPTTGQEVLDEIFGDGEVTLADVLDAGNYEIPADTNTPENNKKDLISKAAIALTEIKENDDLTDGDGDGSTTKVEIVSALKTLVDLPDDSSVVDLKATVDARVAEVNAVKGGKPIATPTSVDGVEDTDYAFPDTPEALTGLFGFRDPEGNDPAADTSSFRGVYIRIDIENASLRLDDNTQVVADTDLSGSDTVDAITGYVYVTFDKLSALKLSPAGDFNGDLALVYRVWDGEEVSSDAELIINIAGVNDAPTLVDDGVATRNVTVGEAVTDITQAYLLGLFNDIDGDALILMVTGLSSGLSHNSTDGITGTPTASGIITVTVVADDGNGGTVEKTLEIAVGQIMNALTGTISLANPTPPNNLQGAYGALKFDAATKTWTYTPDAAARQALRAGEERTETFTFTDATDNSVTEDVEITVVGVNDAPVVDTAIGPQRVTVDLPITAIILENLFSDVDDDVLTLTVTRLPSGLSYARDTGITGTPDTVGTFTVTVMANDGNGGTVETTFDIVVAEGQVVNEDTVEPVSGTISLADPTDPGVLQGTYGELTFDAATKTWTYTLDNTSAAVQALAAGQQVTETFIFTDATDNSVTEDVEITVVGVNDAPEVDTPIERQSVRLDQPVTAIDLSDLFSDVDANDTLTLTGTGLPSGLTYDSVTMMITGTPDTEGTFTVTVMADDGNGGTVETTFDIVVAEGQVVNEDTVEPVSGTISLADPTDPGVLQGTYGELTFDADTKTWTYTLDNTSAAVQALGAGEERTETFTFTDATDGTTEDVEITVVGVNDAPEITVAGGVSVQDGDTSFATNLTVDDVDDGDLAALTSGSFTLAAGTGATAAIVNKFEVVNINGQWQLQLKSGQSIVLADAATFIINVSVTDAGGLTDNVDVAFTVAPARVLIDAGNSDIVGAAFEGDLSTSGDLDPESDVTLASTTPFTISTQGTYGTASIGDDGEWVYKLDNGNADVRALNSGETLTDTFVVNVTATDGTQAQTITITISGRTDVPGTNAPNSSLGDTSTSDNQAIFGFNSRDILTGGSGDDLLVGGYGLDIIDLSAGGRDTVVYRINSSDANSLVKAEDGGDTVIEFTPGEDKLVILDIDGSPTTLTDLFDSLTGAFQLGISGDTDSDFLLSSSELDNGARAFMDIIFEANGTPDGDPASDTAGLTFKINFDRVTSEALNDMTVWDTLTGGTDFSASTVSTVALLSSLFGGFGRPGYDAALDAGDFISIIGPDDLPDSYFEFALSGDDTGSVTDGGAPGDDNTGTLTAPGRTITLDDGNGTYGVMRFNVSSGEWVYTLDDRAEALADQQTATETFIFRAVRETFEVTITITGANDAPTVSGEFFTRVGVTGGQFILTNLSDRFTDVDEGDELTFEATLDDGAALSTIGLTYDSDEDEITGILTGTGTYVIKIVATDKSGATGEATFELNIFSAIPIIQRNSLTYNADATSITIDETMLEVTSGNESDPALLVYTITTLPDAGVLSKSGTPLNNGDTFTQADINNGLITYVPNVSSLFISQSNPLSFTISDGVATLEATLEITSREVVGNTIYEGDPSTSGDLDVNDDTLLDSTIPFSISTQGTYGTASINDDGEWVYTLDNGHADVRALNSGETLTDTFEVNVTDNEGSAQTQTITITISGRTDVLGTNGPDGSLGDASTSDNQAIFGFNSGDTLTGGSGDDLLVGGYGEDTIDLSAGGTDTVVYRINSSDTDGLIKAEDGGDTVMEFTPGEDKLVILDINGSPTTLTDLFDSLTKFRFELGINGDNDGDGDLSDSELDAGARFFIYIVFQASGTVDGILTSNPAGGQVQINFDRVTSEALNGLAVWDTLTGGTNFSENAISTVAQLSSLFGGFGRPGYDAALDDGGFISIIGPDDLPDSYFEIA